jgi:hypothetical protein
MGQPHRTTQPICPNTFLCNACAESVPDTENAQTFNAQLQYSVPTLAQSSNSCPEGHAHVSCKRQLSHTNSRHTVPLPAESSAVTETLQSVHWQRDPQQVSCSIIPRTTYAAHTSAHKCRLTQIMQARVQQKQTFEGSAC